MPATLLGYQRKLSGPIVDRIDLWVKVSKMSHEKLSDTKQGESTAVVHERIAKARELQASRFAEHERQITTNNEMRANDIEKYILLTPALRALFNTSAEKLRLSPRAYHKVLKVARTIADLDASNDIREQHLLEALAYRPTEFR